MEIRRIEAKAVTDTVKELFLRCNYEIGQDILDALAQAREREPSALGREVLGQLLENDRIAAQEQLPICQDTGMAVVFIKVGQEVHIEGGNLTDAIDEGVRQGYVDGYLRKSVVRDPIDRVNTKDNTPAIIHYEIVDGDQVDITGSRHRRHV